MPSYLSNNEDFDRLFITNSELISSYMSELWDWGYNTNGQLGNNNTTWYSSPITTVSGGSNWKQVACGYFHTTGIKTDGTLWLWGTNSNGALGDNTTSNRSSPITTVAGGTNWKQIAGGGYHNAAIKTDGTLWTWGWNAGGQLGDNTTSDRSSPITTILSGNNWIQVACGKNCTSAIKSDGTLWTWGENRFGILGNNTATNKSSPNTTVAGGTNWTQLFSSSSSEHMAAIKSDGTLWTWGRNDQGQLGDNTTVSKLSPVTTAGGGTDWKQVACGYLNTAAIKTDGTLWVWGRNNFGQLGDNNQFTDKSSPVTTIAGGTNWKQVSCGYGSILSIKTDGTLWGCGYNSSGMLGDNTTSHRSSPVQTIVGGTNWTQVSAGGYHTAAKKLLGDY